MSQRSYLVTHVAHYIGQRWVEPGETVTLPEGVKPGRWLVPAGAVVAEQGPVVADKFRAKHNGGGRWIVENVEDGSRASVVFEKDEGDAKAKAEAEAARLNAGGEIKLGGMEALTSSSGEGDPSASTQQAGNELPDA